MAIDLGKHGDGPEENSSNNGNSSGQSANQGSSGRKDYSDPNSHPDVRQIYVYAYECKRKNMPDYQIEQSLMNKGLEPSEMAIVMITVNRLYYQSQQANAQSDNGGGGGGGAVPSGLIIVGLIVLFDILSLALGWGFIIY
jgi:hypothetical protein